MGSATKPSRSPILVYGPMSPFAVPVCAKVLGSLLVPHQCHTLKLKR